MIILFTFELAAAEVLGISDLGLCHPKMDYSRFISQFEGQPVIVTGWLDNTFNKNGCPNAVRLMTEPRPMIARVHILNGPGLRNKRLEKHEIHYPLTIDRLDKKIKKMHPDIIAPFIQRLLTLQALFASRTGETTLFISPCLECDLSNESRRILLTLARQAFPTALLVDNPLKQKCMSGFICEKHGDKNTPAGILDLDGKPLTDVNIKAWKKSTKAKYLRYAWLPCNNGLKIGEEWKPPTKRKSFCQPKDRSALKAFLRE